MFAVVASVCVLVACGANVIVDSDPETDDDGITGVGGDDGEAGGPDTTISTGGSDVGGQPEGGSPEGGAPEGGSGEGGMMPLSSFTVNGAAEGDYTYPTSLLTTLIAPMRLSFSAEEATTIQEVRLIDVGTGSAGDITSLYLYNGWESYVEGVLQPDGVTYVFDVNLLVEPDPEWTPYYSVYVQYDAPSSSHGLTHKFVLESAEMITLSDEREVLGNFPIEGATHTFATPTSATYCDPWNPTAQFGYQGCCGTFQQLSSASELQTGMLFKSNNIEVVYYYASNGTRHVFPTTMILDSWYGPYDADGIPTSDGSVCNAVYELPASEVATVFIGGNMTFRPGVFVTGITTDANARYVVSRGGILHRLMPIGLMEEIYPGMAQSRVRLSKDQFFVNFLMGANITSAAEYDPVVEFNTTIEQNLGLAP